MTREKAIETAAHGIIPSLYLGWPEVVLLISAFFMPPYLLDAMRDRGHKVILLHTEEPYQCDEQLERAAHADINLVNDPVNLQLYRDLGPAEYMPHAYRPQVHYPALPGSAEKWDLSFIGTGFPSRVTFFEAMDLDGLDVHLAGPWLNLPPDSPLRDWAMTEDEGCVDNDQTAGDLPAVHGPASTSTAANPRTRTPGKAGPSAPAKSSSPRAAPGSPGIRGRNQTSCSPCCRPTPAPRRPASRSAGRSRTRTNGGKQQRRRRRP